MQPPPVKPEKKTDTKKTRSIIKFGTKDTITISIALLLMLSGVVMSIYYGFHRELIAIILIAFSLGLLSFLMIGKIETKEISFVGVKISQASGGFLIFILILSGFLGYKKLTNQSKVNFMNADLENSLRIEEPIDSAIWRDAAGTFKWFNPPLAFATDEHKELKMKWFSNPNFQLKILLIQSYNFGQDSAHFIPKLKNLQIFSKLLLIKYKDIPNVLDRVIVRICKDDFIPSQSFFIDNKWGENQSRYSIFYLPSHKDNDKPIKCIVTLSKDFYSILNEEFELHWKHDFIDVSIEKLLNTVITNYTTRDSIKSN